MPRKLSYASALVAAAKPTTSQSPGEVYLLAKVNKLQDENVALKDQPNKIETWLATLECKPHPVQEKIRATKEEFIEATESMQQHLTTEVILTTLKEGELLESIALVVRVGGLPKDWDMQEVKDITSQKRKL